MPGRVGHVRGLAQCGLTGFRVVQVHLQLAHCEQGLGLERPVAELPHLGEQRFGEIVRPLILAGLDAYPNTSYPQAIKQLIGRSSAPPASGTAWPAR